MLRVQLLASARTVRELADSLKEAGRGPAGAGGPAALASTPGAAAGAAPAGDEGSAADEAGVTQVISPQSH